MQREISRIEPMLDEFKKLWEKYPDLRFGQLVCNIVPENQLFYVEDDIMLERIQDWDKNRRCQTINSQEIFERFFDL